MADHLQPFDPDTEYYDDASDYMTPAETPTPQNDDAFSSVSDVPDDWGADAPASPAAPGISDDTVLADLLPAALRPPRR
eukprot:10446013-Alexandrium_andersonii.AAC.1